MNEGVQTTKHEHLKEESNSDNEIGRNEVVPAFIKEFSREESQGERDALAGEIRERRRQRDEVRVEQGVLTEEQEKLTEDLHALAETIESHNDASFLGKIQDYFAYRKAKADIRSKTEMLSGVESSIREKEAEIPEFAETKKLIDDFYKGERKKWAEAGYTPEVIAKYFNEENLSKLSIDEYSELMKRFPGQMVTHVTRQGVRDHNAMWKHRGGMGEHRDGFKKILESGRLHSSLEAALSQAETYHDIRKFLNDGHEPTEERFPNMVKRLKSLTESSAAFNDKTAIHFAVERVLNEIYGGEKGNEFFFAYPSAMVASQTKFSSDPTDPIGGVDSKHNDLFVWEKNERGINVNAGITFIPINAPVDPHTGSRYHLGKNGAPIEEMLVDENQDVSQLNFQKAEQPINSQEYWEKYFFEHPGQRPSKIVYYDTTDSPTQALWK